MLVVFTSAVLWIEIPRLNELIYEMAPAFVLATLAIVCVSVLTNRPKAPKPRPRLSP